MTLDEKIRRYCSIILKWETNPDNRELALIKLGIKLEKEDILRD